MNVARLRPLTATEILDGAFTLYRHHFATFLLTALLPIIPGTLVEIVHLQLGRILSLLGSVLTMGALVHQCSEALLGRKVSLGDGLAVGLRRYFPMAVALLIYLVLLTAGTIALIVPGICLFCMLFAYAPIVVIEKRWDFIGRSRQLARKQWGKISGVLLIGFIIGALPGFAVSLGAMGYYQLGFVAAAQTKAVLIGGALVNAIVSPFTYAVLTLLYYDQRVRKEGLDVQLAVDAMGGEPTRASGADAARAMGAGSAGASDSTPMRAAGR
jgi:hypothetical protein